MQGARRKITKKELKEDQLVTAYYKARAYLDKNGRSVAIAAGAVLVLGVLIGFIINSKIEANITAGYELYKADVLLERAEYGAAISKLHDLIETYPGTVNAAQALVSLADAHFTQGNFDSTAFYAEEYVKKHTGKDVILSCSAYALLASALEEMGDPILAGETFIEAANRYPESYTRPIYLIDAGRCYNIAGDDEKARELYLMVLEEYPGSEVFIRANDQLARAGGSPEAVKPKMKI